MSVDTQVKEAITTFRTQQTLQTQLLTVLIIANATFIGVGIRYSDEPHIFMFGCIFPILILISRLMSEKLMLPVIYSAVSLEHEYETKSDWLATTYFQSLYPNKWLEIQRILKIPRRDDRMEELKKANKSSTMIFAPSNRLVTYVCIFFAIAQLILPIVWCDLGRFIQNYLGFLFCK